MTECNQSVISRRELRRRKILENAELRKQKIFGLVPKTTCDTVNNAVNLQEQQINKSNQEEKNYTENEELPKQRLFGTSSNSSSDTINNLINMQKHHMTSNEGVLKYSDDVDETASTKSLESEVSTKSQSNDDHSSISDVTRLNKILRNIPDPIVEYEDENFYEKRLSPDKDQTTSTLNKEDSNSTFGIKYSEEMDFSPSISNSQNSGNSLLLNGNDKSYMNTAPSFLIHLLEHPASPCLLALVVSFLLYFNLGSLVSHSIIIPFFIWEIQQLIACYGNAEVNESGSSIFETAFLLCGVRRSLILKYIWISKLFKDILDDFSLYIVTISLWGMFIGFPSVSSSS